MQITAETVNRFLLQEGSIGVVDCAGITRMLHPYSLPEYLHLAETANHLWREGIWHSREQFLELCKRFQIEAPVGD